MSLELDFEIEDFEEENEGESLSSAGSASGTESYIDDGELGELEYDESGDFSSCRTHVEVTTRDEISSRTRRAHLEVQGVREIS